MIKINIAKDFSDAPGGRYIREGAYSGEEFREEVLIPKYKEAKSSGQKLQINLDGCFGYPSSFIDEAFAGLAKYENSHNVLQIIEFISNDQPGLVNDIEKCVRQTTPKEK